jgi:integrase
MAVSIITQKPHGEQTLFVRIRRTESIDGHRVETTNITKATGLKTNADKWNLSHTGQAFTAYYLDKGGDGYKTYQKAEELRQILAAELNAEGRITLERASTIIDQVVNGDAKKAISRIDNTVDSFLDFMLARLKPGEPCQIKSIDDSGVFLNDNTAKTLRVGINCIRAYEAKFGALHWDEMDGNFLSDKFVGFLTSQTVGRGRAKGQGYTKNYISKVVQILKTLAKYAKRENPELLVPGSFFEVNVGRQKPNDTEDGKIYLTAEELERFRAVPLEGKAAIARDIFLIGVYTAQRVSDYNNISPDQIIVTKDGKRHIKFRQQKTKQTVRVPVKPALNEILERYGNNIPRMWEQDINDHIKRIGKAAGIDDAIKIVSIRGGREVVETRPKYELICTHTARRTGATLMYLAGLSEWNICAITGHSSSQQLKRYIKADSLDKLRSVEEEDYFNE